MNFNRELSVKIRFLIDELIPPIIRDQYWFMIIPFKILFKDKANAFMTFKQKAPFMTDEEFAQVYKDLAPYFVQRGTDLNDQCLKLILKSIIGNTILEVGSGKGLLAEELSKKYKVTASDIVIDESLKKRNSKITFIKAKVELLPFKDKAFDTVISTHTLEHVQDIYKAISELRRVTRKRLIIVVPMQRPYKYTFDVHLHFFPNPEALRVTMRGNKHSLCKIVEGDLFYQEERDG